MPKSTKQENIVERIHSVRRKNSGIPSNFYNELRAALLDCGSFTTDRELKVIFVDERLHPWRNRLHQASNSIERAENIIDFLHNQYNAVGENALVLLLYALSERLESEDACHQHLADLANRFEHEVNIHNNIKLEDTKQAPPQYLASLNSSQNIIQIAKIAITSVLIIAIILIAIVQVTGLNLQSILLHKLPGSSASSDDTIEGLSGNLTPSNKAIETFMSTALVGEYLQSDAKVNIESIIADPKYSAILQDNYAIWDKRLIEIPEASSFSELAVTIRFAISSNGNFYVGVVGPSSESLALLTGKNEWWPNQLTLRDLLLYRILRQEYIKLENDGHISGGDGLDGQIAFWNNYDEPLHIVYSMLVMMAENNSEWKHSDLLRTWDPSGSGETIYTGSTWRKFSVSYVDDMVSDVNGFFVYGHCHNDNGNQSYVKLDNEELVSCGTTIGSKHGFRFTGTPPEKIEIGGEREWSVIDTSIHIIVVGDTLEVNELSENPPYNDNPAPSFLTILPGIEVETDYISDSYSNDFEDLQDWVQGKSLIDDRCGEPLFQANSKIVDKVNNSYGSSAGYFELQNPIVSNPNKPLNVEIRFRYDGNGEMKIGLFERKEFTCGEGPNDGFVFTTYGGRAGDRYSLNLDEGTLQVGTEHDGAWHTTNLIRDASGYWSMYIDDSLLGTGIHQDLDTNYKYLSIQIYGGFGSEAEIDYLFVNQ